MGHRGSCRQGHEKELDLFELTSRDMTGSGTCKPKVLAIAVE
jgi:hypothetical protein